ncbi:hypothetical protein [Terribacillus sp. DMT04]|uniref:hypothetical protein n=1 Tax=Terribacillus sp. DMT04 TaxID=2850441 RepID=UPI001C2BB7A7|nr:hypothetical protein [Terribacillus sp. DMT04]QXE02428.1 hypothetical protein KS242_04180 [Terribacillus sp. DMT04]
MAKQGSLILVLLLLFLTGCAQGSYDDEMDMVFAQEKAYLKEGSSLELNNMDSEVTVYKGGKYISVKYESGIGLYRKSSDGDYKRQADSNGFEDSDPVITRAVNVD